MRNSISFWTALCFTFKIERVHSFPGVASPSGTFYVLIFSYDMPLGEMFHGINSWTPM
jgi:hypothetical protein